LDDNKSTTGFCVYVGSNIIFMDLINKGGIQN